MIPYLRVQSLILRQIFHNCFLIRISLSIRSILIFLYFLFLQFAIFKQNSLNYYHLEFIEFLLSSFVCLVCSQRNFKTDQKSSFSLISVSFGNGIACIGGATTSTFPALAHFNFGKWIRLIFASEDSLKTKIYRATMAAVRCESFENKMQ